MKPLLSAAVACLAFSLPSCKHKERVPTAEEKAASEQQARAMKIADIERRIGFAKDSLKTREMFVDMAKRTLKDAEDLVRLSPNANEREIRSLRLKDANDKLKQCEEERSKYSQEIYKLEQDRADLNYR